MSFDIDQSTVLNEAGVEVSTMMKTPCLRYKDDFLSMFFDKEDALIVKVSPERVNELVEKGVGMEFNFTKKRFKEWVLIPLEHLDDYDDYIFEALAYARRKGKRKYEKSN